MQLLKKTNSSYSKCKLLFFLLFIGFQFTSFSQDTIRVDDKTTLTTGLTNIPAGTIVIIENNTWDDALVRIKGFGTADMPIVVKSDTIGGVTLTGESYLQIGGEYQTVDGITFTNGLSPNSFVVDFQFDTSTPCNNCSIKNITIDSFELNQNNSTTKNWVRMNGKDNEVAHCSFLNRNSQGACIFVDKDTSIIENHKIHHNYFAHRTPKPTVSQNGQEAIRIGTRNTWNGAMDAGCEVYNNYFYDWFGEAEIISNKSNSNKYYNNTFDEYKGALTLRAGNDCEVYSNFFLAGNNSKSGGVRVVGKGHKIYNNYFDSINNDGSNTMGAINITNGEIMAPDSGYHQVKNVEIVFNTIVGSDRGIRVGTKLFSNLVLPPDSCTIANNLMQSTTDAIEWFDVKPDTLNAYLNNTRNDGSWHLPPSNFGIGNDTTNSLLLDLSYVDSFRHVLPNTLALDEGVGSFPFVDSDIVGGARPNSISLKDAGAEEYGVGGINRPYMPDDTTILVGAGSGFRDICNDKSLSLDYLFIPEKVYQSKKYISAKGFIRSEDNTEFIAKDSICLNEGFEVILGADFEAIIDDCEN